MTTKAHRVRIVLEFIALMPEDELAADDASDEIGDEIVEALQRQTPVRVFDESFKVVDWTSEEVRDD